MIDRLIGPGLQQGESFYFQLIPIGLTIVNKDCELPPRDTTYRFSIFKGSQKFDENRIPIGAQFAQVNGLYALPITSCRLNFYSPLPTRGRKVEFILRMIQHEGNQDYELGDYQIDITSLIDQYKKENVSRHELKTNFSDDYDLEFEIYVDTNRVALQKNIRDKKTDRAIKSPLRQRKESEIQPSSANRKKFGGEKVEEKVEEPEQRVKNEFANEPEPEAVPEPEAPSAPEPEAEVKISESRQSRPAPAAARERSEKTGSIQSKPHIPIVQTKFKPVQLDAEPQVKMTQSQRLGATSTTQAVKPSSQQTLKEKVFLWLFFIVGAVLIFLAMKPSRRV